MPVPPSDTEESPLVLRVQRLASLLAQIVPCPIEWLDADHSNETPTGELLTSVPCDNYRRLIMAWRAAMRWRKEMEDVLCTMLAVALSTEQRGEQLFLMVIGSAGGGKTRFCDAMLVSKHCHALEHLTGFHSGWTDGSGEDFSLLSRINRKTLITPEGDVMMSSPRFGEIMSQQRRIFDGSSGASYKNKKEDTKYSGLRTPWIIAGTPALLSSDQSKLGDRFLKVFIEKPDQDEREAILQRVTQNALEAVRMKSETTAENQLTPELCLAYQLTGGYVDYLRENAVDLLSEVECEDDKLLQCSKLGEFAAYMRARPEPDPKKDTVPTVEEPTRISHQLVRKAVCITVVINKKKVDGEVMRRIHKIAFDTSRGFPFDITMLLHKAGEEGAEVRAIAFATGRSEDKTRFMLRFLEQIKVVKLNKAKAGSGAKTKGNRWKLTNHLKRLCRAVLPPEENDDIPF